MGAAAAAQRYALGADQIAREVEQIDESYGEVAGLIRTNGVTESMILDSEPESLLDDLNVTNNLQRRKLKAVCDGLREARESGLRISASDAQRSKFAPLVVGLAFRYFRAYDPADRVGDGEQRQRDPEDCRVVL